MSDERVIPLPATGDLATFTLEVDGSEISPETNVGNIIIRKEYNKIASATIILLDGDVAEQDFAVSNSEVFVPGNEVEVFAGYHSEESSIFKGIIISQGLKIRKNKPSQLVVECKDKAVHMTGTRNSSYFSEMSDSDIIDEIAGTYSLDTEVEATEVTHPEMVQYNCTDWDFILTRAEANSQLVIAEDGTLKVGAADPGQEPVLNLNYGSTLMEFEASMDARNQIPTSKGFSWDYSAQEIIEEEGTDPGLAEAGNLSASDLSQVIEYEADNLRHSGKVVDQELKSWSDAKIFRSRLAKTLGRARCQGYGEVKPGTVVGFSGVGDRYNGNHLITAVRHQLDVENWTTDIRFGMPKNWFADKVDVMERPAAALLPGVRGLQVGICKQIGEDPDGEDRILVTLPIIDPDGDGVWARVASLDAGENRGAFFRPEIDDEVLVGFLNDDPRDPIVLGMLNSSAKPAPITGSDDNHEKGFVTRSEMKMIFNDDEISYTLETPNGNKIVLSDDSGSILIEDENSNKIEMTSDGITIESPGDINITAGGDTNIEGTNCSVTASAEFKAEGSAGAEVSSSAVAKVKGSLVQIN
ncbi:type VI secretion system tip protein VgrG [Aliikangiella coralliicola]|uniref:Type VI secretion system tip protein VgrG n=1 Tax=Aliikangiella coralliicola TaxID=2592383 RepID=A0A545UD85_9GAMM|nr:type VI secretion system tip protein VgrG [Aliikangiella coralliicola]TQV87434.1 type VI secretion system tip protein VgrG [Aliikangiella coralliicola]